LGNLAAQFAAFPLSASNAQAQTELAQGKQRIFLDLVEPDQESAVLIGLLALSFREAQRREIQVLYLSFRIGFSREESALELVISNSAVEVAEKYRFLVDLTAQTRLRTTRNDKNEGLAARLKAAYFQNAVPGRLKAVPVQLKQG